MTRPPIAMRHLLPFGINVVAVLAAMMLAISTVFVPLLAVVHVILNLECVVHFHIVAGFALFRDG
jgi:hypothetical protein